MQSTWLCWRIWHKRQHTHSKVGNHAIDVKESPDVDRTTCNDDRIAHHRNQGINEPIHEIPEIEVRVTIYQGTNQCV